MIGKQVGNYQIVRELGRGGMAVVYKAWQASLNRYVALKVLPAYFQHDGEFLARFQREAQAAAQFTHPNIVSIYDTGEVDGLHYIAMEYLEGGSLSERLAGRPLDLAEAERIVREVGSALDYAHGRGLVHRDIKPGNILFTAEGTAKVSDFGIVRAADGTRLTRTGVLLGTPEYMAPEQVEGGQVDRRADLYALGVVLYQMVTGVVPFRGTTPHAVMHAVIYQAPPPPRAGNPGLSQAVEGVLLKALAKEPGERFQSGREMGEAVGRARRGGTVEVPSSARGRVEPQVATGGRGVPRAAWVGLVAVVVVCMVVWLVLSAGGARGEEATATAWAQTQVAGVWTATAQAGGDARATLDAQATEEARVTPDGESAGSGTETAEALERGGLTATAEMARWQATQTAIVAATEIDVAVQQTAAAMGTRMASEATQTALARPTDTPLPRPTDTPNPSPTPQPTRRPTLAPTRQPTPVPPTATLKPACATQPGWPFDAMGSAPKLGCATSPAGSTHYSHQYFEGGQMIYRGDLRRIYVLYYVDGTWESFPDTYNEGEPWYLNELDPPPGLKQPIKGFDRVWELNPQVLNKIGWAQRDEVGVIGGNFQDFQNGTALWMSHPGYLTSYFLLFSDGTWGQRQG